MGWTVGIDIGGTFTDTVVMGEDGAFSTYKTPTTPGRLLDGLLDNLAAAAADRDLDVERLLAETTRVAHGTTAATNDYVERRGARVALVSTRGFEDTIFMQRMLGMTAGLSASELTDYSLRRVPEPLCPRRLVFGVRERVDYRGEVIAPLQEADVLAAAEALREEGVEAVAVSLLWSFKNPAHERRVAELLADALPGVYVSVSSELAPRLGEYERTATTLVNAYLGPRVARYTEALQQRLAGTPVFLLDSSGGVMTPKQAGASAVRLLLSGPSGGVTAAQYISSALGHRNVLTFDMGGTSADVGLVVGGEILQRHETETGGFHLLLPMVDVRAIGAGGGSLARVEEGGYLRVGPESAGADPGPACYGRGGAYPTVTDADLVLGALNPDNFLGGRLQVSVQAARAAIEQHVSGPLGISVEEGAAGIKRIIDTRMADLLRTVTVERGHDPRDFVLYAFGGAGPTHAPAFALDVVDTVVVPTGQAVLCAFGAVASDITLKTERGVPIRLSREAGGADADTEAIERVFGELEQRAHALLEEQGVGRERRRLRRIVEVRFTRQTKTLPVPFDGSVARLLSGFLDRYAVRYGSEAVPERAGFELVTLVVDARGELTRPRLARHRPGSNDPSAAVSGRREVYDAVTAQLLDTAVYDGGLLSAGNRLAGPAVVEFSGSTVVLASNQEAHVDELLNIVIRRTR